MLAVFFLNLTFVFAITGKTYSFFLAYRLMHGFTFKFKIRTTRNRSIDTMTPNKLAVYFVADIDFQCGLYGLWPHSLMHGELRQARLIIALVLDSLRCVTGRASGCTQRCATPAQQAMGSPQILPTHVSR